MMTVLACHGGWLVRIAGVFTPDDIIHLSEIIQHHRQGLDVIAPPPPHPVRVTEGHDDYGVRELPWMIKSLTAGTFQAN